MSPIHEKFLSRKSTLEAELGESLTIDGIAGPYRIFQRVKGQRHSIDDAATAWYAINKSPNASRILDLGTGIGSVGFATLWGLSSTATLVCVEAQAISYALLKENIVCNELEYRVRAIHGDIRDLNLEEKFPLVTGSPPYFPATAGVLPSDSQKAFARFELRGDVSDYARAAKRHLCEDGVFVFCFPFQQKKRGIKLVEDEGFSFISIKDVIPRIGKAPLFSLYAAQFRSDLTLVEEPPLIVSDEDGGYTDEMLEVQKIRGFGALGSNVVD